MFIRDIPGRFWVFVMVFDPVKFEVFLRMFATRLADFERRAERMRVRAEQADDGGALRAKVRRRVRRVRRRFELERHGLVDMAAGMTAQN